MEKLDKILGSYAATADGTKGKLFGASFIVITKDGRNPTLPTIAVPLLMLPMAGPVYEGSAGHIDASPDSPKYGTDTVQWVASMTKLLTTICVLQLAEEGKWTLDDDLRPLVPEMAQAEILEGFDEDGQPILVANTKPITIR